MTSKIDELLTRYAQLATEAEPTSVGFYTHYGLLSDFLREAQPLLVTPAPETAEERADRIFKVYGADRRIGASRALLKELRDAGEDYDPFQSKTLIDDAAQRVGITLPGTLR